MAIVSSTKTMAHAGLFLMLYPATQWVNANYILQRHAKMIAQNIIPARDHTENVQDAMVGLADCGECVFDCD